ncbi:sensor histidine kinase [Nocardia terrae]|uniref:sensor histidine kinase n=1 Tax=Nocardia terrae TaxID=2675851 RepID=UPI0012FA3FAD|nr:histidine kinase [Nocardia terrae]
MNPSRVDRRGRILAGSAALAVALVGVAEALISIHANVFPNRGTLIPIVVMTAVAVGLCRRWPGVAVALVWLLLGYHAITAAPLLYAEVALAAVLFAGTRWGRLGTSMAGALAAAVIGVLAVWSLGSYSALLFITLLGGAWLAGLALRRSADRADASLASQRAAEAETEQAHREREQAREIARLREEQAQLARDVHDVVGHSLAVILAQAESAQFLGADDGAALRDSLANIATLARASLRDVRQVLTANDAPDTGPGELRTLVEGVRAGGYEISFDETGPARTLPPDLATVAYRVVQEMLTNAIRHGSRESPVVVEVEWAGELRIRTVNAVAEPETGSGGSGLDGMRRRVESVGGRLEIRREDTHEPSTFSVIAWIPVRRLVA